MSVKTLFLLALAPVWADDRAGDILKRHLEAEVLNAKRAAEYAYIERKDNFGFDKAGSRRKESSETHDVIFVEGEPYRKLIARNERPLDAKEVAKEEKKMRSAAEARRRERRGGVFHKQVSLASDEELLKVFDNRLLGEEEIAGRKTWIIECSPPAGRVPANEHEKEILSFQTKLWIDQTEFVLAKSVKTVVGSHIFLMPGSTISTDFEKVNNDAWLAVSMTIDGRLQFAKIIKPRVRAEYHNSDFKKFDVQSTISVEKP